MANVDPAHGGADAESLPSAHGGAGTGVAPVGADADVALVGKTAYHKHVKAVGSSLQEVERCMDNPVTGEDRFGKAASILESLSTPVRGATYTAMQAIESWESHNPGSTKHGDLEHKRLALKQRILSARTSSRIDEKIEKVLDDTGRIEHDVCNLENTTHGIEMKLARLHMSKPDREPGMSDADRMAQLQECVSRHRHAIKECEEELAHLKLDDAYRKRKAAIELGEFGGRKKRKSTASLGATSAAASATNGPPRADSPPLVGAPGASPPLPTPRSTGTVSSPRLGVPTLTPEQAANTRRLKAESLASTDVRVLTDQRR